MHPNFSKPFKIALGFSLVLALSLYLASYLHTRESVFLLLNTNMGQIGDFVFNLISYLAEGWIWIPYFMLVFGWFKKDALFILINFLLSTIFHES